MKTKWIAKGLTAAAVLALSMTGALADTVWTRGEVKKIDLAQSKLTIKHEEIKNLDMPSMTMVFYVPDKSLLDHLKPGQTAEFEFGDENGRMVVKQVKP